MDYSEMREQLEQLNQRIRENIKMLDGIISNFPRINPQPQPSLHYIQNYTLGDLGLVTLRQYPEKIDPSKPIVFLDEGHGGLDEHGNYTTPPHHGKRFQHPPSLVDGGMDKDGEGWIYEGVLNRRIVSELCRHLQAMEIQYIIISHSVEDRDLDLRVDIVNTLYKMFPKGFLWSGHCNALRGESTGSCLFTTRGQTISDIIAQHIAPYLYDLEDVWEDDGFWVRDGSGKVKEIDYEKNFTILMCVPPAVMSEVLFFDSKIDIKLLLNKDFIHQYTLAVANGFNSYLTNPDTPRPLPKN